jgi:hypothetical protein
LISLGFWKELCLFYNDAGLWYHFSLLRTLTKTYQQIPAHFWSLPTGHILGALSQAYQEPGGPKQRLKKTYWKTGYPHPKE